MQRLRLINLRKVSNVKYKVQIIIKRVKANVVLQNVSIST